jgi:hypothetical protein
MKTVWYLLHSFMEICWTIYRGFEVLAKASEEQNYGHSVHKLSDVEPPNGWLVLISFMLLSTLKIFSSFLP